jgi:hypothetical protein
MADVEDVGREVEQEPKGEPTLKVPGGSSGQSSETQQQGGESALLKRFDALESKLGSLEQKLPDLVDARFKSSKDKNIYAMKQDVAELKQLIEASGGDFSRVKGDVEANELRQRFAELEAQVKGAGGTAAPKPAAAFREAATAEKLRKAEIPFDDPEYTALVDRYADAPMSDEQWLTLVDMFTDRRSTKAAKQTNAGEAAAVTESGTPPPEGQDALRAAYEEEKKDLRGQPNAIIALKMAYREKGLDIV